MMNRYLRQLQNRMNFDELEYGYQEFTFRIGKHKISQDEVTDAKFQSILRKLQKCLNKMNVSEMLIDRS